MQALVTGGSGFIGSEVIRQLLGQGVRVRALLRKTSSRRNLEGLDYETQIGDLGDLPALKAGVKGVDYVFHIAGSISARSREEFFDHNAKGTANLAQACREVNPALKRFVYVSSLAASGPAQSLKPRVESENDQPISVYGESKLGGEQALKAFTDAFPVTIVRPPPVYGPRDRGIFEFVKLANLGFAPVFRGSNETGEKYYSMIHVEDLVQGIVLAGLAPNQGRNEVFFLCGDGVHSWSQVMRAMSDGLNKKPVALRLPNFAWTSIAAAYTAAGKIFKREFPFNLDKLSEMRPDYWICSNERAKQVLGFKPKWDLSAGMKQTIAWYKEHGWV